MPSDPRIRASDADRDRAAEALREHHATGRLSMEEFTDRLDRVYAAKTLGDLDELMADLPAIDLYQLPIPASQRFVPPRPPAPASHGRMSPAWRAAWASWASVSLVLVVIWLITAGIGSGGSAYFWPIWVAGPWGAVMLARWIFGSGPGGGDQGRPEWHTRRQDLRAQRHQMRRDLRGQRRDLRDEPGDPGGGQSADP
ncbi:MAG TPA: DUF1707 domain-containing protein [Streptosporangiaceae bacterium]|nr:DUF1707 domain-containing protein [Streptosporangiaceae bacterium]